MASKKVNRKRKFKHQKLEAEEKQSNHFEFNRKNCYQS